MGWNEKKILLQFCLGFYKKDIISNLCFTTYEKIRLFIKFLGFSIRFCLNLEIIVILVKCLLHCTERHFGKLSMLNLL